MEVYRRELMIDALDADYAALQADPDAWPLERSERAIWDATSADGLEPE